MSLVFEADIPDLEYTKDGEARKAKASTVNGLLLAYADHANDEGEGSYPGYTRLERKTKLSRQGIADTIEACKQNGYLELTGKSKLDTNSYALNKPLLESLNTPLKDESSHLTPTSQATLPARVKPLDLNHPLTIIKPERDSEPTDFQKVVNLLGVVNGDTARLVGVWLEKHVIARIEQAIEIGKTKKVRNLAPYVNEILIGWDANGYPKTYEERVAERKAQAKISPKASPPADDNFEQELAAKRARLKSEPVKFIGATA